MKRKSKVIGYLRVSTIDQNTEKNKSQILTFSNDHDFGKVTFVEEKVSGSVSWKKRKLKMVVDELQKDDIIIVPELSRLGRSLSDVLNILQVLTDKDIKIFSVKENFQINGNDLQSKILKVFLSLFSEISVDMLKMRVSEGLAAARLKGRIGGRPKGSGTSKFDTHKDEIVSLIQKGVKKNYIAKSYGLTPGALSSWLKKNKLTHIKPKIT